MNCMWIGNNHWEAGIKNLEKFFIERIIQRCDYHEVISNKHRTVNGYIQVKELIKLSELSQKRERTVRTLHILVEEAKSDVLSQNINNDIIINKYFNDLKLYIKDINKNSFGTLTQPNLSKIRSFYHDLKKFETQLDKHYYDLLKSEILNIDYSNEEEYETKADLITKLVDILIPFFVYKGYSISSISEVIIKWKKNGYRITPKKILTYFSFKIKEFHFLINLKDINQETIDFSNLLKETYKDLSFGIGSELDQVFTERYDIKNQDQIARFKFQAIDPHSHVRNSYDTLLKKILIHRERPSLSAFNDFFGSCFWWSTSDIIKFKKVSVDSDPINVNGRISTLRETLKHSVYQYQYHFDDSTLIPIPTKSETLKKAIYYYNIALGSKSIENSLSLLWTSLETILPYRFGSSDIECIQNFVAKTLCIGAYSRDIYSFSTRLMKTDSTHDSQLAELKNGFGNQYTSEGQYQWFNWLLNEEESTKRLEILKPHSELLAYGYVKLGRPLSQGKLDYFLKRIKSSENSIKFQLQRIYLHRNQIVHSGDLVNEYTNLWVNLEWYIGKLLAIALIRQDFLKDGKNIGDIYREIEADYDYLLSYLEKNKNKKIKDSQRIISFLFNNPWQSF